MANEMICERGRESFSCLAVHRCRLRNLAKTRCKEKMGKIDQERERERERGKKREAELETACSTTLR